MQCPLVSSWYILVDCPCNMNTTHANQPQPSKLALSATLHCLTGCGIGEVLGMVISTIFGLANLPSIVLSIVLAFFFGYGLTVRPLIAGGIPFAQAVRLALASDTVSIVVMELVDNAVILFIPGAIDAGLNDLLFWGSLAVSLVLAFLVAFPVNLWLIKRGWGHAVVHGSGHGDH